MNLRELTAQIFALFSLSILNINQKVPQGSIN